MRALDSFAPAAGVGPIASTARASALASWVVDSPEPAPDPVANKRGKEAWVVLTQPGPQLLDDLRPSPHRVLVSTCQNGHRPGEVGVVGQHPVQVCIGAQDVGQRHRIDVVALLARYRGPFPIPGHRERVDRVDRATRCPQRRDQKPPRCLDRDRDQRLPAVAHVREHRDELGKPLH